MEKLKAKKKAEVLAITRGDEEDSDVELMAEDAAPAPPAKDETPQEVGMASTIKRLCD